MPLNGVFLLSIFGIAMFVTHGSRTWILDSGLLTQVSLPRKTLGHGLEWDKLDLHPIS